MNEIALLDRPSEIVDTDAIEIGDLYRRSQTCIVESMQCALEAGRRLILKKADLSHGEWLPWLKSNAGILAFDTPSTAARLMKAAAANMSPNMTLNVTFDDRRAIEISRTIWGNSNVRGTQGTGENEWYTPPQYLDLARKVLGRIDLDPASSAKAQKTVHAKKFFTKKQNGLKRLWRGRVWLNPPYSQPDIGLFADKILAEVTARRVSAAIMLTHNYTDTVWFQALAAKALAICFTRGRVKFVDAAGEECAPTQGQAFFYFGSNRRKFAKLFSEIGFVVGRL